MISLRDISTLCGISVSTASRALRDYSDISTETKNYVQSVASIIGYGSSGQNRKPSGRTQRSRCIGLVYQGMREDEAVYGADLKIFQYLREQARKSAYDIMLIRGGKDCERDLSWLACARFHALEGIIILAGSMETYNNGTMDLLASEIPVVAVGQSYEGNTCINIDFASGMDFLMREVYSCGYRKIAFICPEFGTESDVRRTSYLRNVLRLGFSSLPEHLMLADRNNYEKIVYCTKRLISGRECPECILYPDDISAIWGVETLKKEGVHVPEDIGVAGFGGLFHYFGLGSVLTSWHFDFEKIGSLAFQSLFERIENPELFLPQTYMVGGTTVRGNTTI